MPEYINLKDIFAAMNHVVEPALSADRHGETVLNYDHAASMVKRFAADDAVVYSVLAGGASCPGLDHAFKTSESKPLLTPADYNHYYRRSDPEDIGFMPGILIGETNHKLIFEQGSGYANTLHLVDLIAQALTCRILLDPTFPRMTEEAECEVKMLIWLLDKQQRTRFPVFEEEVTALKNLALPSNPFDTRLSKPARLRSVFEAEFDRLIAPSNAPCHPEKRLPCP